MKIKGNFIPKKRGKRRLIIKFGRKMRERNRKIN
jgi:hypothetical protein